MLDPAAATRGQAAARRPARSHLRRRARAGRRSSRPAPSVRRADLPPAGPVHQPRRCAGRRRRASRSPSAERRRHARPRQPGGQGDPRQGRASWPATSSSASCCRSSSRRSRQRSWKKKGLKEGWLRVTKETLARQGARRRHAGVAGALAALHPRHVLERGVRATTSLASVDLLRAREGHVRRSHLRVRSLHPQPHARRERAHAARGAARADDDVRRRSRTRAAASCCATWSSAPASSGRSRGASSSAAPCWSPRRTRARRSRRRNAGTRRSAGRQPARAVSRQPVHDRRGVRRQRPRLARQPRVRRHPRPARDGRTGRSDRAASGAARPARRRVLGARRQLQPDRRRAASPARCRARSVLRVGQRPRRALGGRLADRPRERARCSFRRRASAASGRAATCPSDSVTHVSFFSHAETVDFLVNALEGRRQPLNGVDPRKRLPDRRLLRGAAPARAAAPARPLAPTRQGPARPSRPAAPASEPLQVTVINGDLTFEPEPRCCSATTARRDLTGTERSWTGSIGGTMDHSLRRRAVSAGGRDRIEIFINRHLDKERGTFIPRPKAVIVVGLGAEGKLEAGRPRADRAAGRDRLGAPTRRTWRGTTGCSRLRAGQHAHRQRRQRASRRARPRGSSRRACSRRTSSCWTTPRRRRPLAARAAACASSSCTWTGRRKPGARCACSGARRQAASRSSEVVQTRRRRAAASARFGLSRRRLRLHHGRSARSEGRRAAPSSTRSTPSGRAARFAGSAPRAACSTSWSRPRRTIRIATSGSAARSFNLLVPVELEAYLAGSGEMQIALDPEHGGAFRGSCSTSNRDGRSDRASRGRSGRSCCGSCASTAFRDQVVDARRRRRACS